MFWDNFHFIFNVLLQNWILKSITLSILFLKKVVYIQVVQIISTDPVALKHTVLASSVLAVWLGREHPARPYILSGCEGVCIGAEAHVHAWPFRKLKYAAPKMQSWTTVCNNIKWRLKRSRFPLSLWVTCVPLLLLGDGRVCLHCGDNDVPTTPEAWRPYSSVAVCPLSCWVITSLIPSAHSSRVHLGYYQRSYLGSALQFCHIGSATSRGLIVFAVF